MTNEQTNAAKVATEGERLAATAQRLRELAAKEAEEDHADGFRAGEDWAHDAATPRELRRLEGEMEQVSPADFAEIANNRHNVGAARLLAAVIDPRKIAQAGDLSGFWTSAGVDDHARLNTSNDFARGFIEGALSVWAQAKAAV